MEDFIIGKREGEKLTATNAHPTMLSGYLLKLCGAIGRVAVANIAPR